MPGGVRSSTSAPLGVVAVAMQLCPRSSSLDEILSAVGHGGQCRNTSALIRDNSAPAHPAHAADRFAREILAILERDTTRSRRLMRNSLGGSRLPACAGVVSSKRIAVCLAFDCPLVLTPLPAA